DVRAGIVELFTQLTKLARCRTQLLLAIVELNELCGDLLALVFDFRLELRDSFDGRGDGLDGVDDSRRSLPRDSVARGGAGRRRTRRHGRFAVHMAVSGRF